jgi:hypothetical protein
LENKHKPACWSLPEHFDHGRLPLFPSLWETVDEQTEAALSV